MIENLHFPPKFEPNFLSMQINSFLDINTRYLGITETINKKKAIKKLLNRLEYYKKHNRILIYLLKDCKNLEDFKIIIKNKLKEDVDIGRGKKTKRRRIKKKETKRRKKPRKKKN